MCGFELTNALANEQLMAMYIYIHICFIYICIYLFVHASPKVLQVLFLTCQALLRQYKHFLGSPLLLRRRLCSFTARFLVAVVIVI